MRAGLEEPACNARLSWTSLIPSLPGFLKTVSENYCAIPHTVVELALMLLSVLLESACSLYSNSLKLGVF